MPEDLWRTGRARVLQHFLDAPVIYPDPDFRSRLEAPARANLQRELAAFRVVSGKAGFDITNI